jgi:hypothetical protein
LRWSGHEAIRADDRCALSRVEFVHERRRIDVKVVRITAQKAAHVHGGRKRFESLILQRFEEAWGDARFLGDQLDAETATFARAAQR